MPSLIDLRRRIRAVKSTEQITKAMKTVAASKLRRAQDRIVGARPFAQLMQRVLSDLATRTGAAAEHPLLAPPVKPDAAILLFVVTADKGLCGSFNSNLIRHATSFAVEAGQEVAMGLVGRKGRDFFVRRGVDVRFQMVNLFNDLRYSHAEAMAETAIEQYTSGAASGVSVVYNEFKSVLQQAVVIDPVLPIPARRGGRGAHPCRPQHAVRGVPAALLAAGLHDRATHRSAPRPDHHGRKPGSLPGQVRTDRIAEQTLLAPGRVARVRNHLGPWHPLLLSRLAVRAGR